jgi:hypothetical protein
LVKRNASDCSRSRRELVVNRVKTGPWHDGQHLRHHAVTSRIAQQGSAQLLQRLGHVGEGRTVAQGAWLPLDQRDVGNSPTSTVLVPDA